jgi:hypothetical protein
MFSINTVTLSLKSKPFPDMLVKLQPTILMLLLPVATTTLVLQFTKLQFIINRLLFDVVLTTQVAEFSTTHRSNAILDSDAHSTQFSAIFSNLQSLA